MCLPPLIDFGCKAVAFDGCQRHVLRDKDAMYVKAIKVSGLGNNGCNSAFHCVEIGIWCCRRRKTIKAQGCHQIALAQNHDVRSGKADERQMFGEMAFACQSRPADLEERCTWFCISDTVKRHSCLPCAGIGSAFPAPPHRKRAAPRRNAAPCRRQTKAPDRRGIRQGRRSETSSR